MFCALASFSQEKENYTAIASQFTDLYNAEDYKAIFNLFNADMKNALSIEKAEAFLAGMKATLGDIDTMKFDKLKKGVSHIYKTTFSSEELRDILIYLDDENKIGGLMVTMHKPNNLPIVERNTTQMILPFKEEWFVFWGGTTVDKNYHVAYENQQYAYDILMVKDGASHKGDPKNNENYYVFGKDIIAPCDAKVVKVITGVIDNIPGELNPEQLTGNTVVLQTEHDEYILFAHLKEKSVVVKEGQMLKQGDLMGQCGNSGNTTEAHLHLSLQNDIDMNMSTGGKIYFDKIMVNGEIKDDYLPVKEDLVKNIN